MLQGGSHVSRDPILLLGNIIYAPCHISLNVGIKVKQKTKKNNITPRIVSLGRLWEKQTRYVYILRSKCGKHQKCFL